MLCVLYIKGTFFEMQQGTGVGKQKAELLIEINQWSVCDLGGFRQI